MYFLHSLENVLIEKTHCRDCTVKVIIIMPIHISKAFFFEEYSYLSNSNLLLLFNAKGNKVKLVSIFDFVKLRYILGHPKTETCSSFMELKEYAYTYS